MIISEEKGRITGVRFDSETGVLELIAEMARGDVSRERQLVETVFPFNRNRPYSFTLDELREKRVLITVELIED